MFTRRREYSSTKLTSPSTAPSYGVVIGNRSEDVLFMKTCNVCNKARNGAEFWRCGNGRTRAECSSCAREYWKSYRLQPERMEYQKGYHKVYTQQTKARTKFLIRQLTCAKIRKGELVRELCSICGDKNTQMHHENYLKPFKVTSLCFQCHKLLHKEVVGVA